jgi:hypothetical protein
LPEAALDPDGDADMSVGDVPGPEQAEPAEAEMEAGTKRADESGLHKL